MNERKVEKLYHSITNVNSQFIAEAQTGTNPSRLRFEWWNFHKAAACFVAVVLAAALTCGTAFAANAGFRQAVISFLFPVYTERTLYEIDEGHRTGSFSMEDTLFTFLEKFNRETLIEGITAKKDSGFAYTVLSGDNGGVKVIVDCDEINDKLLVMMEKTDYEETTGLWQVIAYQMIDGETADEIIAEKG